MDNPMHIHIYVHTNSYILTFLVNKIQLFGIISQAL